VLPQPLALTMSSYIKKGGKKKKVWTTSEVEKEKELKTKPAYESRKRSRKAKASQAPASDNTGSRIS
jgi:hypothetical protein